MCGPDIPPSAEDAADDAAGSSRSDFAAGSMSGYRIPQWLGWHAGQFLWTIPARLLIGGVRLYQIFLSPIFGRNCRFYPTCSRYTVLAIRKYGAVAGVLKGAGRILRCHPFHPGGYDPP